MTWLIGTTLKKDKFKLFKYEPSVFLHFKNSTQIILCVATRVKNKTTLNFN